MEQHLTEALIQLEAIRNMNPSKYRRPIQIRDRTARNGYRDPML